MRMSRLAAGYLGFTTACFAAIVRADEAAQVQPHYYTLSISLAPALCQLHPENRQLRICQEGYSIIVQGFWPESQDGRRVRNCSRENPELSPVQERVLEKVMSRANRLRLPSQINKEGRDQVMDRSQLVSDIMKLNAGLPEKGIYLRCNLQEGTPLLTELRVCYKPNGEFTECSSSFKPNCPTTFTVRAVP